MNNKMHEVQVFSSAILLLLFVFAMIYLVSCNMHSEKVCNNIVASSCRTEHKVEWQNKILVSKTIQKCTNQWEDGHIEYDVGHSLAIGSKACYTIWVSDKK